MGGLTLSGGDLDGQPFTRVALGEAVSSWGILAAGKFCP